MPEQSLTDLSRRQLAMAGTAAVLSVGGTTLAGQSVESKPLEEDKPQLEFLMELAGRV